MKGTINMTKLTLNNTEFTISGYNRYTNIDQDGIHSYANVNFPNNSQYAALTQVGAISSLSISIDGTSVYSLSNISARITSINEDLYDQGVRMNAQITFNPADAEEE